MKTVIAKISWLSESDLRLDASYHLSDGQLAIIAFKKANIPTKSLSTVTEKIFYGGRSKRIYVNDPKFGLPFIKGSDIIKVDFSNLKYISRKRTPNLKEYFLEHGWTVLTRSGTIGNAAYVNKDYIGKAASDDIIRVVPKSVLPGFLYAFLSSKHGKALITHGTYGAVIQHIEPEHIENIPVPIFPPEKQQHIHDQITQSAENRVEANKLLEEATAKFLKFNELSFSDNLIGIFEKDTKNNFTVKSSEFKTLSLKARNYSYRAQQIMRILEKREGVYLDKYLAEPFQMGARASFKRITAANFKGHDIISQGDIHKQNPKIFKQVKIKKNDFEGRAKKATIIMPSAGTLGENEVFTRPLLVRNNFEGKLLSEVVGIFKCKSEEEAAYLYIFLSLQACFRILRAMVYGTNLLYPNWEFLKNIKVPLCSDIERTEISNIVLKAFDLRAEANLKENQAIQLVEKGIEQWQQ